MIPHRPVLLAVGIFVTLIGLTLLVAPETYLRVYVTTYVSGMEFGARRFAPAVMGLGILLILARDLAVDRFLIALCLLTGVMFWAVAATGVHALLTEVARPTILIAAVIEIVIGAVFLWISRALSKQV